MATIKEIENQIVEEFSIFDDWMDKYQYIIDLGKNLPVIEESEKKRREPHKGMSEQSVVKL